MQHEAATRGVYDLGGVTGYGPVPHDPAEPPFKADWEKRVFGLLGAVTSVAARRPGEFRYVLERLDPCDYFGHGYYGRWLAGFEVLLAEQGVVSPDEMAAAVEARAGVPPCEAVEASPALRVGTVAVLDTALLPPDRPAEIPQSRTQNRTQGRKQGRPLTQDRPARQDRTVRRLLAERPRFSVGDRVIASGPLQPGHTRLPNYAVGKLGTVVKLHPAEVLPDSTAHNMGERPQHVYCVRYDARTLWGNDADPNAAIHVDLYECYLEC